MRSTSKALLALVLALWAGTAFGQTLTRPSFALQGTTATGDMDYDGYSWAAAKPIVVDQYGKILMIAQRTNGGNKRHLFVTSGDSGATWSDPSLSGMFDASGEGFLERGAMAYDSVNDLFHVLWIGLDDDTGVIYRRYSVTRDGSNNITAVTRVSGVNLQVDYDSAGTQSVSYQHPMIFWMSDGGANGQILAIWTTRNAAGSPTNRNEIRASMRVLSNTTADNTAGNWAAPVSADTTTTGQSPQVAYSAVIANNNSAILYFSAGKKTTGTNAKDIYVFYHDADNVGTMEYRFRRMRWNSGSSNWSTGLSTDTAVQALVGSGTDTGYNLKQQIMSQVTEDTGGDRMCIGYAWWKSNTDGDTQAFNCITSTDTVETRVDVYSAGGAASLFPTLDMIYDNTADRLVYVYQKTTTEDFWVKTYDSTNAAAQGETAVKIGIDLDVPLIYDGRVNGKLFIAFRDHVGGSPAFDGWSGTMDWDSNAYTISANATGTDTGGTSSTTVATTLNAVSSGFLLVACVLERDGGSFTGVSDSVNGAWTQVFSRAASAARVAIYYYQNSAAGNPVVTATFGSSTSPKIIAAAAFSGMQTTGVLDTSGNTSNASATAHPHSSITPSAVSMIFTCQGYSTDSNGVTYDTGYTGLPTLTWPAGWLNRGGVSYKLNHTGATNPSNTTSNSVADEGGLAAFLQTSGGGGGGGSTISGFRSLLGGFGR